MERYRMRERDTGNEKELDKEKIERKREWNRKATKIIQIENVKRGIHLCYVLHVLV